LRFFPGLPQVRLIGVAMHRFLFALIASLLTAAAAAQSAFDDNSIPPTLREWRGWVLKDLEFRACPFLAAPFL
jgi:hypothetical protein